MEPRRKKVKRRLKSEKKIRQKSSLWILDSLAPWISLTVLKNHVHAVWNSAPLSLSLMSSGRWAPRQETIQSAEPLRLFPVNSYQLRKHNIYIWIWIIQLKSTQLLKWFLRLLSFIISSQHSISEKYVSLSCLELDCWRQKTRRERERKSRI